MLMPSLRGEGGNRGTYQKVSVSVKQKIIPPDGVEKMDIHILQASLVKAVCYRQAPNALQSALL